MAKARVLVIDDEDIVRISCKRTLMPEGYDVDVAAGGKEGLELYVNGKYDLVLIDLKMPVMDGIEVMLNIQKLSPEQKVIMMTGYNTPDDMAESVRAGISAYLEKPFTPDTLVERVKRILGK